VDIVTNSEAAQIDIGLTEVATLREALHGTLLTPSDPRYDEARKVWNGAIDRRPALIARCADADDVRTAVRFARDHDLPTAVRGGGHGVAGSAICDDGLVIDLSPMTAISVDPSARALTAQAGVLWGEVDRATQAFGLATTGGIVSHTGIAGLTLGGGLGWLMRRHGLTVDNLRSADVVTADGGYRTANEAENPDLFWGLRGGGGNFGVVTSFEYHLHPVGPTVLAGPIFFALEDAGGLLDFYRDWIADSPDELATILNFRRAPAASFLPESLHGRPVVAVVTFYSGRIEDGEDVLRPLRSHGRPIIDLIGPKPYVSHQSMFDPLVPHGWHYYWKSCDVSALSDHLVDQLVSHTQAITSPRSYTLVFQLGGATGRVAADATAYSHRTSGYTININAAWTAGDAAADAHIAWARDFFAAVEPSGSGAYVNFLGSEGEDRVRAAYPERTFARLQALKKTYDPTNFFRFNQNITPGD
jgi:FAD/FMN-containing dehydrogenase